jgi:hypothetical protein
MRLLAISAINRVAKKGDILRDSRGSDWTFQSVTHPRKVYVTAKDDPNGPDSYPNMASREFYASVFDLGIWDIDAQEWTFEPSWDATDLTYILRAEGQEDIYTKQNTAEYKALTLRLLHKAQTLHSDVYDEKWELSGDLDKIDEIVAKLRKQLNAN